MEDLAGPHAVPIRIPRVAARRQESSVDTDAFLVHTQINVTNRQHSGKPQLREVTASLGPFTAAAAQKQESCAQLMEAQLMEARRQK